MANIAQGEVECYICHETLTKSCIRILYKRSGSDFKCFIVCILHLLMHKYNTNGWFSLIKSVNELYVSIYNYSIVLQLPNHSTITTQLQFYNYALPDTLWHITF